MIAAWRNQRRTAALVGMAAAAVACKAAVGEDAPPATLRDANYRIVAEALPDFGDTGSLRIRVEPAAGWHIAPDAPARLRVEPGREAASDAAELVGQTSEQIDFDCRVATDRNGRVARAQLKFGMCEGEDSACEIVRREFEIHLASGELALR